jgi:hypothetical protein
MLLFSHVANFAACEVLSKQLPGFVPRGLDCAGAWLDSNLPRESHMGGVQWTMVWRGMSQNQVWPSPASLWSHSSQYLSRPHP